MMMKNKIILNTIGADPEVFVKELTSDEIIPCIGFFDGTKDEPDIYILDDNLSVGIQEDNVMFEFNLTPATTKLDFISNMHKTIQFCEEILSTRGLEMVVRSSFDFHPNALVDPQALKSGCDPDENAWKEELTPSVDLSQITMRSAGKNVCPSFM